MIAKDSLASTLTVVATLNGKLALLSHEYTCFQLIADEASAMAIEEILSIRYVLSI